MDASGLHWGIDAGWILVGSMTWGTLSVLDGNSISSPQRMTIAPKRSIPRARQTELGDGQWP
jgi:hypothetical protein